MRYLAYKEQRTHGTIDFPAAFYGITPHHPQYSMVYHWHPEHEIIHVLSGELALILDGVEYRLHTGDAAFVTGGVLHGATPYDCHYECLVFDMAAMLEGKYIRNTELVSILNGDKKIQCFFPAREDAAMCFLRYIFDAARTKAPGYQLLLQGALYSFFGAVIRQGLCNEEILHTSATKRLGQFKAVLSIIKSHYQNDLTLQELADCSGMNSKYFCRFFKEMTKKTPIEYLNYYRIECACEQMLSTDKTLTEIALGCGFNDVSYFIRVFKKHKGTTPSQYGKQTIQS